MRDRVGNELGRPIERRLDLDSCHPVPFLARPTATSAFAVGRVSKSQVWPWSLAGGARAPRTCLALDRGNRPGPRVPPGDAAARVGPRTLGVLTLPHRFWGSALAGRRGSPLRVVAPPAEGVLDKAGGYQAFGELDVGTGDRLLVASVHTSPHEAPPWGTVGTGEKRSPGPASGSPGGTMSRSQATATWWPGGGSSCAATGALRVGWTRTGCPSPSAGSSSTGPRPGLDRTHSTLRAARARPGTARRTRASRSSTTSSPWRGLRRYVERRLRYLSTGTALRGPGDPRR